MSLLVVLRALGLGDFLAALPALRGLRAAHPHDHLVLAAPAPLEPLVQHAGAVDELEPTEGLSTISRSKPDMAVNLHGRGPQSHRLLEASGPGRVLAFRHPEVPASATGPEWSEDEHERDRWCRLLRESGVPADPNDVDLVPPCRPVPSEARGKVLIHPGGSSGARRWPAAGWAQVAASLTALGHPVCVSAGPGEEALAGGLGQPVWSGGDVLDLTSIVAASRLVLSGDTGIAHLATALRRPSVVLYGPTSPAVWGPPADRTWHRLLWRGHTGDPWASEPHPDLLDIRPEEVVEAASELLDTCPPAPIGT